MNKPPGRYDVTVRVAKDDGHWMAGTGGEPAGKPVYALAAVGVKSL